jgi:hypothetical protein
MVRTLAILLLVCLGACATAPRFEADVTRFHSSPPQPGNTVVLLPMAGEAEDSLAFRAQAEAVASELNRLGFPPAPAASADLVGTLSVVSRLREAAPAPSPVRIGVGMGGGSRSGVSGGIGVSTGVGSARPRQVVDAEMALQLRRSADRLVLWEGRAVASGVQLGGAQDALTLNADLAAALLRDFPGPSGTTQRVRLP